MSILPTTLPAAGPMPSSVGGPTPGPATGRTHSVRRGPGRVVLGLVSALAVAGSSWLSVGPAAADPVVTPTAGVFTVSGQGFGHGIGMSQYGAYGAAVRGLTWQQILSFYYSGTVLKPLASTAGIRVWITADNDNVLRLVPTAGLQVRDASGHHYLLPAGPNYRSWRISRSGSGYKLTYLTSTGSWKVQPTGLATTTWTASDTARVMKVIMPGGVTREYRGTLSQAKHGRGGRTVDTLSMEDYLKGVVPSEMPTSWAVNAVRAQAVAARSYAARLQADARSGTGYDICDTSSCQVYKPYASSRHGRRTVNETIRGNAAVAATAHQVLTWGTSIAFTQFSASNGGYEIAGGHPYLRARVDPYDGVVSRNAWSRTVTATTLQRQWPTAGAVRAVQVTLRDGGGRWGGRVTTITIIGARKTVSVPGSTFEHRFGLRSTLFTVTSA